MHIVRMKGKSVEEAVKSALEVLKATRESVEIRIISEGEPGVLGVFGGKDAEVEVKVRQEMPEQARITLQDMLDKMGFITQVYVNEKTEENISLDIKGDDISRIIGREGQTIDALQYLVNIIANKNAEKRKRIEVDAGGYRKKQEKRIERIVKETVEEVEISGKEIELPPMNSKERRIVHMLVKDMPKVSSHSIGERNDRRVVITPKA